MDIIIVNTNHKLGNKFKLNYYYMITRMSLMYSKKTWCMSSCQYCDRKRRLLDEREREKGTLGRKYNCLLVQLALVLQHGKFPRKLIRNRRAQKDRSFSALCFSRDISLILTKSRPFETSRNFIFVTKARKENYIKDEWGKKA